MQGKVKNEVDQPIAARDVQVLKTKTVPFIEVEDLQQSAEKAAGDEDVRDGSRKLGEGMLRPEPK